MHNDETNPSARPARQKLSGHLRQLERATLRHAHKFLLQRFANLRDVKRHALSWLVLVGGLIGLMVWQTTLTAQSFSTLVPAEGGTYTEGAAGSLDTLNPLFAGTPAERSAARLLFAQLVQYDARGDLVGELAREWQSDGSGKVYTVTLKPGLTWSNGLPLTASDVVFTFNLIKDADTRSSFYSSWRNIGIEKVDATQVRFTLPVANAAFPNSLTVGILPEHALKTLRPSELRTASFNRLPTVSSGPFMFQDLQTLDSEQSHSLLRLVANKTYALGATKLAGFHLHAYKDREDVPKAFRSQEIASFSDASLLQLHGLEGIPHAESQSPLFNGVYAFLKMDTPLLSDGRVRTALKLATDQAAVHKKLQNVVQPLEGPILPGQLGYTPELRQSGMDIARAKPLLDEAGWREVSPGKRQKDGQPLRLNLVTVSSGDFPAVAEEVMTQWRKIGVEFDSHPIKAEDIYQNIIVPRAYDVLIYEIAIGRDPDVYAYWHSSQATERGLNLSNYKSAKVDDALDAARTRVEPTQRAARYKLFIQQWLNDVPAIALYRPTLVYVQNNNVVTYNSHVMVEPTDRYYNIRYWAAGRELLRPTK